MPRFFFHVYDGQSLPDQEGTELAGWRHAQQEAVRYAGRIISDDASKIRLGEDWRMEVVDERGLVLFVLDFYVGGSAATLGTNRDKTA